MGWPLTVLLVLIEIKISEPLCLSTSLTSTRRGCWGLLPWHVRSFVELKEEEQEEEEELLLMPHECGG